MRNNYQIVKKTKDKIYIIDTCVGKSITNDAEGVVKELFDSGHGKFQIIYKDTEGIWSELLHNGAGEFTDFYDILDQDREDLPENKE